LLRSYAIDTICTACSRTLIHSKQYNSSSTIRQ